MTKHLNKRTKRAVLFLCLVLPYFALADDMGGIKNPLMIMLIGAAFCIFFLMPVVAWLVSMNILKRKILNKNDYISLKITTFWAEFASGAIGFFIILFQRWEGWYGVLGFSLPVLSAIVLITYAIVRKN